MVKLNDSCLIYDALVVYIALTQIKDVSLPLGREPSRDLSCSDWPGAEAT